jgi:hypothetical protein
MFKALVIVSILTFALSYSFASDDRSGSVSNYSTVNNNPHKDITFPPVKQHELFHFEAPSGNTNKKSTLNITAWNCLNPVGFINFLSFLFY